MGIVFLQGASAGGSLSLPTGTSAAASGLTLRVKRITPTDDVEVALDTSGADIIEVDLTNAAVNSYMTIAGLSGGTDGRMVFIHNMGDPLKDKDIIVFYDNTNAAAGNRILGPRDAIPANSTAAHGTILRINQGVLTPLYYSSAIGGWILTTLGAGDYNSNFIWQNVNSTTPSYGGGGV